jgi:small subunit ribosomal protein S6
MDNHYELTYIVSIKHTGDDAQKIIDSVTKLLKDQKADITADTNLGKLRLAYPIKKTHQGTYVSVEFNMPGANLKELDNKLKVADGLLRHLIIVKKEKTAEELEHEQKVQERLLKRKEDELAGGNAIKAAVATKEEGAPAEKTPEEKLADTKVETPEIEIKEKKEKGKVSLEDLDKKLNEILTDDII